MIMRVITQRAQNSKRWAYCKVCGVRTDQHEVLTAEAHKQIWECESCHCWLNKNGEPVAH